MLRFSPNGCLAAVSTPEGRVKIWDTPSKTLKHDIGPLREIGCVCFQPDSTRPLVGVGTADNVIIYDCTRGENYAVLSVPSGVSCMCWTVKGDGLLTGHLSGEVLQWDIEDKVVVRTLQADTTSICSISLSTSGRHLLTASRCIKMWKMKKLKHIKVYKGHIQEVVKMCFIGEDNSHFISLGKEDRMIQIWSEKQTTPLFVLTCDSHVINFDCHFPKKTDVLGGSVVAACEDGSVSEFMVDFMSSSTPVTPHCTVQFVEEKQRDVPVPISMLDVKLEPDRITVAYGNMIKPIFEVLEFPLQEKHKILVRNVPTNLLLPKTKRTDKKKSEMGKVTVAGPMPKQDTMSSSAETVLKDLVEIPPEKKVKQNKPSTASVTQLIVQAVTSQDSKLLESALSNQGKEREIRSTVEKLPPSTVLPFMRQLIEKVELKPASTVPMATGALGYLEELSAVRLSSYERVCRLHGKLDVLLSMVSRSDERPTTDLMPLLVHEVDTDDRLTDDDGEDSDWSDSEVDNQSDQEENSLESEDLSTDD